MRWLSISVTFRCTTSDTRSPAAYAVIRMVRCLRLAIDSKKVVMYVLNNPGRAPAYCSSREGDALFEEMRQKWNLIAACNAVSQVVPE
jgi:hypothetical protein